MPFTELDLSAALFPGDYGTYDGAAITGSTSGSYPDWVIDGLVLDPETTYTFEFDIADWDPGATSCVVWMFSQNDEPVDDAYANSGWYRFGIATGDSSGVAQTISVTVGPGLDRWADAVAAGEMHVVFESNHELRITGARWSVYEEPVTYPGPWLDDSIPTESVVGGGDTNFPGTGDTATTWGWESFSSASFATPAAERNEQAWAGTGTVSTGPGHELSAISMFYTTGPGAEYQSVWDLTWLTVVRPEVTVTEGVAPDGVFDDPNVVGIEWEPTSTPIDQSISVRAYNATASLPVGVTIPVKLVDGVSAPRYEPDFETRTTFNARSTVANLTTVSDGGSAVSGTVIVPSPPISLSSEAFAVAVPDPFTAGESFPAEPLDSYSLRFGVSLSYVFKPRYRLLYAAPPVPPVIERLRAPALRQLHRGGTGGIGGIPRAVGNPTRHASPRRGSGTVL